ncbi:PREDICTED: putative SWI/SNF-related matrix-associated actin-dependent regulator of chromatin subfamily A member 3-like 2 isoform X2 [Tarenaya hassleriana]|uniref:putative SWI/SNF-related matrix-associated actin-dependent regulator of chromatin subfamily A member 3-like 2 isoform X2 n=1 Tax=Tarenaya hassleriana TaxID=28532 RepID=UPI00053C8834|nr:PREDICTED: putative SWI/SNF-related matrix-associated actin-dependent regulator of chromatin subfamily A member 3-like 2 isoform X2 [Tarenaya hassleriana]
MGTKVPYQLLSTVRSVVGSDYSDMDIIRALHMANQDPTAAINIIFDTPSFRNPDSGARSPSCSQKPASNRTKSVENSIKGCRFSDNGSVGTNPAEEGESVDRGEVGVSGNEWWFVGCAEVSGLSTCKGRRLKPDDELNFTFPPKKRVPSSGSTPGKGFGRGRQAVTGGSEIVRFSTKDSGEIGRIPNEWARCLLPLVSDKKIRIEARCKSAPEVLGIMDTVLLSVSVYINSSMFQKHHQTSLKTASNSTEETVVHPLPNLFRLLGLTPFKKAEFTPDDLSTRKRPLGSKDGFSLPTALLPMNKVKNQNQNVNEDENEQCIADGDLDNLVGVGDSSGLEEMDAPNTLLCELRPYQKQALHWMTQLERGHFTDEAGTMLHPCWEAYRLADKRDLVVYLNLFSGDATIHFPSTLQMARGGILADAMGLGKTIMTIAFMLVHSHRGASHSVDSIISDGDKEISHLSEESTNTSNKATKFSGFDKLHKQQNILANGGNLIICPMTLLGQWKSEIETHVKPGSLSVYVHYGQSRPKDAKVLSQSDVVITTYGVLSSEFSAENSEDNGGLFAVRWFRLVLDEAHTIKSSKSQVSLAAAALVADRRWCLTGTPIQNNLEDLYSLLRFLRIEPWGTWAWWNKLVQKPFEEGDERGLKLVQSILKPIMLRRTKSSTDREGRPILVLPPADTQVIYCKLSEAERDFYDALFKRSKVKFDQFVEQGRVLHNYASILELLLRLRQCCDHPFLVMSRGDTQEYSDLNKLAKRFLNGKSNGLEGEEKDVLPSVAFVQEVVEELRKGEQGECPICLEAFEDAVLTPCAHRLCRECLLASWRNASSGLCPVCRKTINRQDLITAPTQNRFQVDVEKNWVESSKTIALLQELENLRSSGSKSILFSQWTAFLDLLQIPLSRNNISFVRLDGTLNQNQREKVIKQFSEDSSILVMLMSLKAGGVGINLTAACNAFVMDPWWNPAVEEQAVMRIHRIGQTKKVSIRRFIVKGTVEERMEAVQARKQRLISGALTDQEVRTARIEELKMLFT